MLHLKMVYHFYTCQTEINDVFIDEANHIYIAMPVYNLIEYSDNYLDASGNLSQFKRGEVPNNNSDFIIDSSQSFKYKAALVGKTADVVNNTNLSVKITKIIVPLKYLSNFWRSIAIQSINCKIHLELNWIEDCILSDGGDSAKFKITDAKLHVPIATLSIKYEVSLTKQLSDGFKRSLYWNKYQTVPAKVINQGTNIYELLSASFQGVKRLFVLAYFIAAPAEGNNPPPPVDETAGIKNNKKYFLPRGEIKNYNVLIDGRNFYDQPINDIIKQYDEVRKVSTGYGDDYTTGCLLDYAYFKDNYRLIAVDLSKQKALDADPRAI